MSDAATRFHETWLGMVQPVEGLVVSVPALVAAQCMERLPIEVQRTLHALCPEREDGTRRVADLDDFLDQLLGFAPEAFDRGEALPEALQLYVAEGRQTLRPTLALRKLEFPDDEGEGEAKGPSEAGPRLDDSTPASRAGRPYAMLVWQLPDELDLDKPEEVTGPWHYPPTAKFDRLLRECRVPVGLLVNGRTIRLMYCPHGESSGAMSFHVDDMAEVGGRPILDAFVMLLHEFRWFGVEEERALPAILADSRARQADVTDALADQLFEALGILLAGFEAAAEREAETADRLREALEAGDDRLYGGLLTLLLRLVFLLYAEDRDLMPMEQPSYGAHLSVLALHDELQADADRFPDTMARRYGAYPRLLAAFRAVYYGLRHGELYIPPRHGALFDPARYPFLEGWEPGGAVPLAARDRAGLRVPSISDEVVYRVLHRLLILDGQRLSYRALEVEQIGSVYEALMGYHVRRVPTREDGRGGPALCLRPARVWVSPGELEAVAKNQRVKWLQARGLSKSQARKLAEAFAAALSKGDEGEEDGRVEALRAAAIKTLPAAGPGRLVIQPGEERRRTSSHYTPRSLSEPIVQRTLEPLIAAMDEAGEPSSDKLLRLKVCDPAMGSGAFLVAAVRYLADQLVAAWTREGALDEIVDAHEDPVVHARRLVAQRCIYGVDKNPFAVDLAKLSLWLETLARDQPFTFVDHALKCGDSLVGLDLEQIKAFDWQRPVPAGERKRKSKKKAKQKPSARQLDLFEGVIERALLRAYDARRELLALAEAEGDKAELTAQKEALHEQAELALERARMIADCVIGAFFAEAKDKARKQQLAARRAEVEAWLLSGPDARAPVKVRQWVEQIREQVRPFHWWLEFPEVFWDERRDPLEEDHTEGAAWMDAFFGNPPFLGGNRVWPILGAPYRDWLLRQHTPAHANGDLSAHFFRRAHNLLGKHGTAGFIATNTISQGDTRTTGLQALLASQDCRIYQASTDVPWPGTAGVTVTVIHIAEGLQAVLIRPTLNKQPTDFINSRLLPHPERPDPVALQANHNKCFVGTFVFGSGFILTPEQRQDLVKKSAKNAEKTFPYIGGAEINTSPTHAANRYVIYFGDYPLQKVEQWPDLLDIVHKKVKPHRDTLKGYSVAESRRKNWWKPGTPATDLYIAIKNIDRCIATSQVSKHIVFAFQPTDRIFGHMLNVFPFETYAWISALQCRIHVVWVTLMGSSMRSDPRYTPSVCFFTFPFPPEDQLTPDSPLEDIGARLYETRAAFMIDTDQGLTKTYNALKDPSVTDPRVEELRELHVEMDRAVLAAYGWSDIEVPPYTDPQTPAEQAARQAFEDEVIDRLFVLNAKRAAEERKLGAKTSKGKGKGKGKGK